MNSEKKPFLPHPIHKPLAYVVVSILVGMASFGLIWLGLYLGGSFKLLVAVGTIIFLVAFATALVFYFKYGWSVFVRRGWRKEHEDYMKSLETKQPWE